MLLFHHLEKAFGILEVCFGSDNVDRDMGSIASKSIKLTRVQRINSRRSYDFVDQERPTERMRQIAKNVNTDRNVREFAQFWRTGGSLMAFFVSNEEELRRRRNTVRRLDRMYKKRMRQVITDEAYYNVYKTQYRRNAMH